jgi:hypothetical protein
MESNRIGMHKHPDAASAKKRQIVLKVLQQGRFPARKIDVCVPLHLIGREKLQNSQSVVLRWKMHIITSVSTIGTPKVTNAVVLQIDMPQAGKGYVSVTFMLNHETSLAVHVAVVVVEHPDILFPLLDNKIFGDYASRDILCTAKHLRH